MDELQVENGNFTRIVNKAIDELVKAGLLGAELSIVLFVIRKTWGFNKLEDKLSLSQIEEATLISRPTVVKSLKNLIYNKLLVKRALPNKEIVYKFNKYYTQWGSKAGLTSKAVLTRPSKHRLTRTSKAGLTHKRQEKQLKTIRADKPLKDKFETNKYPKADYIKILDRYQQLKGIKLQGDEYLPPMAEIKRMFKSGRSPDQIIQTMEICEDNYEDWAMSTVRMKIADVVGGKLFSKNKLKNQGMIIKESINI